MKINERIVFATGELMKRLALLQRWNGDIKQEQYSQLAKQAFNCIVAFFLGVISEHQGKKVCWENFPKIAFYRSFRRAYVYYAIPESIIDEICECGGMEKKRFEEATLQKIKELADESFAEFICEALGSYEFELYSAAAKVANYIEFMENKEKFGKKTFVEVVQALKDYKHIPGVKELSDTESPMFNMLKEISKLRNQTRWEAFASTMPCSVLGHLFETAVFAYFMSLEQTPYDEGLATRAFFMGIFHDVAETWTKDMASTIKDAIDGLREATEVHELKKIEEHMYRVVPPYMAKALREVMFEDESNSAYKKLLKGADYLSADGECYRQYLKGTRDKKFYFVVSDRRVKIKSGDVALTPMCEHLYKFYLSELRNLLTKQEILKDFLKHHLSH